MKSQLSVICNCGSKQPMFANRNRNISVPIISNSRRGMRDHMRHMCSWLLCRNQDECVSPRTCKPSAVHCWLHYDACQNCKSGISFSHRNTKISRPPDCGLLRLCASRMFIRLYRALSPVTVTLSLVCKSDGNLPPCVLPSSPCLQLVFSLSTPWLWRCVR